MPNLTRITRLAVFKLKMGLAMALPVGIGKFGRTADGHMSISEPLFHAFGHEVTCLNFLITWHKFYQFVAVYCGI